MSIDSVQIAQTRSHRGGRRAIGALAAVVFAAIAALGPATAASASDWGGYASPLSSTCAPLSPVTETAVYNSSGVYVGLLQIKYSNGCPGNYARFQSSVGPAQRVALSIQSTVGWKNQAGADETDASTVFTRIIQLNNPSDTVCAYFNADYYGYGYVAKSVCA